MALECALRAAGPDEAWTPFTACRPRRPRPSAAGDFRAGRGASRTAGSGRGPPASAVAVEVPPSALRPWDPPAPHAPDSPAARSVRRPLRSRLATWALEIPSRLAVARLDMGAAPCPPARRPRTRRCEEGRTPRQPAKRCTSRRRRRSEAARARRCARTRAAARTRARLSLARALGELPDPAAGPEPEAAPLFDPRPPPAPPAARCAPTLGARTEEVDGTAPFASLGTLEPVGTLGTDGTETLGTEGVETLGTEGVGTDGTLTDSDLGAESRGAVLPSGRPPNASAPATTRAAIDTAAATSGLRAVLGIRSLPAGVRRPLADGSPAQDLFPGPARFNRAAGRSGRAAEAVVEDRNPRTNHVGRWESVLEVEGVGSGAMSSQVVDSALGVGDRRDLTGGDPPQREVGLGEPGEPLPPTAHHIQVTAHVHEVPQRLRALPDRQVDDHPVVVERAHGGRVSVLGLEPPDNPGAPVRQRVHGVEECHELVELGRVERGARQRDVHLREVIAGLAHLALENWRV